MGQKKLEDQHHLNDCSHLSYHPTHDCQGVLATLVSFGTGGQRMVSKAAAAFNCRSQFFACAGVGGAVGLVADLPSVAFDVSVQWIAAAAVPLVALIL